MDERQSSVLSGSGYSSGWCPHRRRSKNLAISRAAVESGPWLYSWRMQHWVITIITCKYWAV